MCAAIRSVWHDTPDNAIAYAKHYSRSAHAVIPVYDTAGNVIDARAQGSATANVELSVTGDIFRYLSFDSTRILYNGDVKLDLVSWVQRAMA